MTAAGSDGQQPYRFAVTGGRDFTDERMVRAALSRVRPDAVMVNGDCPTGLDAIAKRVWQEDGRQVELHPADWETHGKAAGPMRNEVMARSGITSVLVFPGGRGTADMRLRCVAAGVEVADVLVEQETCANCDGFGYYDDSAAVACPVCDGTGKEPESDDRFE